MALFIQIFISTVFLVSALFKCFSLENFRDSIQELGFGSKISKLLCYLVIVLEFFITFLILFENTLLIGAFLLLGILFLFTWAAWKSIRLGKSINCNCFGSLTNEKLGIKTFIHILPLLILDITILTHSKKASILNADLFEIIIDVFSSLGLIAIFLLLTTFHNVYSLLNQGR